MARSRNKVMEQKIVLAKSQVNRLEAATNVSRMKARATLLEAHEAGMTQTTLAKLWSTNPTRMKHILAQALAERSK